MICNDSCHHLLWSLSWFVVVRGGSWWFIVVRSGSWWFVVVFVVCGSFSKILKKISCDPLFNQSESKIQYQISF